MTRLFGPSVFVTLIGAACGFLTHFLLAKILPAGQYGIFSFIFSLSTTIAMFALFGFQNSLVRFIPVLRQGEDSAGKITGLILFTRAFTLAGAVLCGAVVYGGLYLSGMSAKYPPVSLFLGLALVVLMVFLRLNYGILRGFKRGAASIFYETTWRELGMVILLTASVIFGLKITDGVQALLLMAFVLLAGGIVSFIHAGIVRRKNSAPARPLYNIREWLGVSLPMMLIIFAQRLMRRTDMIALGFMLNPALVGAYGLMAQFADGSQLTEKPVQAVFSPLIAELHKTGEKEKLRRMYFKATGFIAASTFLIAACVAFFAPYVVPFFGDGYMTAYHALLILLTGGVISSTLSPATHLLTMSAHEGPAMKTTIAAAAGNIILTPLLVLAYGLEGAAISTAVISVLRGASHAYLVRRYRLLYS